MNAHTALLVIGKNNPTGHPQVNGQTVLLGKTVGRVITHAVTWLNLKMDTLDESQTKKKDSRTITFPFLTELLKSLELLIPNLEWR